MKKLFVIMLAVLLLFSAACAEDFSGMTDEELYNYINLARTELLSRKAKTDEKVYVVNDDNIEIYLTGKKKMDYDGFKLEIVFINKTDKDLGAHFTHTVVNGWETSSSTFINLIGAGKKIKDEIEINLEDADLSDYKEIEDMEFEIRIYDSSFNEYKIYKGILLSFDESDWS